MENKCLTGFLIINLLLSVFGCGDDDDRIKVSDSRGVELGSLVSASNNIYTVLTNIGNIVNYYAATGEIATCPPMSYSDAFCNERAHVKIEEDSFLMPEMLICKNRNNILMRPESTIIHKEKATSYLGVAMNGESKCSLYSKVDNYKAQLYVEVKNLSEKYSASGPLFIHY